MTDQNWQNRSGFTVTSSASLNPGQDVDKLDLRYGIRSNRIQQISLEWSKIPVSWFFCHDEFLNNKFHIAVYNGVTISHGIINMDKLPIFNATTLAQQLQNTLNSVFAPIFATFTVTYDSINFQLVITITTPLFSFLIYQLDTFLNPNDIYLQRNSLRLIGCVDVPSFKNAPTLVDIGQFVTSKLTGIPAANPIDLISVKIEGVPSNNTSPYSDIATFYVPIDSPYGYFSEFSSNTLYNFSVNTHNASNFNLENLQIRLTTQFGTRIPFQKNVPVSMYFSCVYSDKNTF